MILVLFVSDLFCHHSYKHVYQKFFKTLKAGNLI
jgi:hypothetical protein